MEQLGKRIRKLLREAAGLAYEIELSRELDKLHGTFERWRRGEVSPFDLSDAIHRFHAGPNRTLYLRYAEGNPLIEVAGAVRTGILKLDELHPDVRVHVERILSLFEAPGSTEGAGPGTPAGAQDQGG